MTYVFLPWVGNDNLVAFPNTLTHYKATLHKALVVYLLCNESEMAFTQKNESSLCVILILL